MRGVSGSAERAAYVIDESVQWRSSWHPVGSVHIDDGPFEFYLHHGEATLLRYHRAAGEAGLIADQAMAVAAGYGARALRVTIGVGTFADLGVDDVLARGAEVVAVVDVLARDLDAGVAISDDIPVPDDVAVSRVRTDADLDGFASVSQRAWGFAPPVLAESGFSIADPAVRLFVARICLDGRDDAIGAAGYELVGTTARLWGAAIVEAQRGRGGYRALVAARLADAGASGARLALVHAEQTSSPILQRLGFVNYAQRRLVRIPIVANGSANR